MYTATVSSAARIVRHPIHPMLVIVPLLCFIGALLTDITYWRTAEMMWADFSAWLVTVGMVLGWLAAIAGLVDLFGGRYVGPAASVWLYVLASLLALVLGTFDMLVHTHDAWTSVVPWGLSLSAATVIVFLFAVWVSWSMAYRTDLEVIET